MIPLLKIELRRYLYPMLLSYLFYAFFFMLSGHRYRLDSLVTDIGIGILTFTLLLLQIKDLLFNYPLMYRQTTHSPSRIFYSRVLVVFIPGLLLLFLALTMINIKAGILYAEHPMAFIVAEHSSIRYVLIGKRFIEFFVPIHTIINHYLYVVIILFTAVSIKQTIDFTRLKTTALRKGWLVLRVLLLHVLYRVILLGLMVLFREVDLNYYRYYNVLGSMWSPFYVNFLFFPAILIYGFDYRRLHLLIHQRMIPLEHVYIPRIMDIYERAEQKR